MYFKTLSTFTLSLLFLFNCEGKHILKRETSVVHENSSDKDIKVGIVGAGITGLYAALLLNELGIDYEILEATNRSGGRFYTHYFDDDNGSNYNYVDMGAMRFPVSPDFDIETGKQNWSLVSYLNSRLESTKQLKLIPFLMNNENNIYYFNCVKKLRSELKNCSNCFGFGRNIGKYIDNNYIKTKYSDLEEKAVDFLDENMAKHGLKYLIENDYKTFREFLMDPNGFDFDSEIIDLIETVSSTGRFSHSIMDLYLAERFFNANFVAIEGGTSKIIDALLSILKKKPKLNNQVTEVKQLSSKEMQVKTNMESNNFTHLILTPTFSAMRSINFNCNLSIKKRTAMRSLNYQLAVKVGLSFKTRFWENSTLMNGKPTFGGVSETDLPIRQIVYPSYGINCTSCPGALLASYVRNKDAKYFLSFSDKEVVDIILKNLATIHGPIVYDQYTGKSIVINWTKNRFTQGAFPRFNAGHFESFFPDLIKPDAQGRMHFAGDTITLHHGWSNGCLTSAFRAVKNILVEHKFHEKIKQLQDTWGNVLDPADISHDV